CRMCLTVSGFNTKRSRRDFRVSPNRAFESGRSPAARAAQRERLGVRNGATDRERMKQILGLMLGLLALLIVESPAAQTTYPEKPIRMVVSRPPGSSQDTIARAFGHKFAEAWCKPVVIDN